MERRDFFGRSKQDLLKLASRSRGFSLLSWALGADEPVSRGRVSANEAPAGTGSAKTVRRKLIVPGEAATLRGTPFPPGARHLARIALPGVPLKPSARQELLLVVHAPDSGAALSVLSVERDQNGQVRHTIGLDFNRVISLGELVEGSDPAALAAPAPLRELIPQMALLPWGNLLLAEREGSLLEFNPVAGSLVRLSKLEGLRPTSFRAAWKSGSPVCIESSGATFFSKTSFGARDRRGAFETLFEGELRSGSLSDHSESRELPECPSCSVVSDYCLDSQTGALWSE